jgi:hypothetical protein
LLLSRGKNKMAVAFCALAASAYFSYALVLYRRGPGGCVFHFNAYFTVWVKYILDYGVFILLPGLTILIANIIIIATLFRTKSKKLKEGQDKKDAASASIVAMLIATSAAYLILKTPYHLFIVLVDSHQGDSVSRNGSAVYSWEDVGLALTGSAQLINHGINFYLYVLTGREFRKILGQTLCKRMGRGDLEMSSIRTVSSVMN